MMNDFDGEIIAPEEIELTNNPNKVSGLILEANDHIADEGTTHTKELDTKKEKDARRNYPDHMERNVSTHSQEYCLLKDKGRVANQYNESASAFHIFEQIINLDFLTEILV